MWPAWKGLACNQKSNEKCWAEWSSDGRLSFIIIPYSGLADIAHIDLLDLLLGYACTLNGRLDGYGTQTGSWEAREAAPEAAHGGPSGSQDDDVVQLRGGRAGVAAFGQVQGL